MTDLNLNRPPSITIDQTTAVACEKCSNQTFIETTMLRKASKLLTGAPKDTYVPISVFSCTACNHTNDEFVPKELKKPQIAV